jgi:hypothetical protein
VGAVAGFFWGFGQMVGRMGQDVWSGRVTETSEYLSIWGQNIIAGVEIGAGIDVTIASGGLLGMSVGGALISAGLDAATVHGEAQRWSQFATSQVVEGGKGAAYGLAFGVLGKAVAGVAKWAAPAVQRVAATPAGQFVQRTVQSAVGKVAETAVGRGAAHAAQATGRAASSVGSKVASGARALGAEADDLAARVGLERAAQAPTQLGKALARVEEGAGRAIANAFGAGSPPAPAAAPLAAGVEAGSAEATVAAGSAGAINVGERGLGHVLARHFPGGAQTAGKSLFSAGETVPGLVRGAESVAPVLQRGGNFQRVVEAGRAIGVDRATGLPTTTYTVITNAAGDLVTMFPGVP